MTKMLFGSLQYRLLFKCSSLEMIVIKVFPYRLWSLRRRRNGPKCVLGIRTLSLLLCQTTMLSKRDDIIGCVCQLYVGTTYLIVSFRHRIRAVHLEDISDYTDCVHKLAKNRIISAECFAFSSVLWQIVYLLRTPHCENGIIGCTLIFFRIFVDFFNCKRFQRLNSRIHSRYISPD